MYRPCVVIPVYNHQQKIECLIEAIGDQGYPCIIIDDGSDSHCRSVLEKIAQRPTVSLIRMDKNSGKGAAVCKGIYAAYSAGYSCALQIDADGQHNVADIPVFFAAAQNHPEHIIAGVRVYKNAPKARYYGRMLTDVWVWINTLSFTIKDSMCGFRVYPLAQTKALLDKQSVGRRMSFDTDILVRLYWEGLQVTQIETQVIYDDQIPSHFDVLKDNVRISLMHAQLFFGMIVRAPKLIMRHFLSTES